MSKLKSDVTDALIFSILVAAVIFYGLKHYAATFDKCMEKEKNWDRCQDLLR